MVRKILKIFAIVIFILFLVYLRVFIGQYKEFKKGEEAYSNLNFKDAVVYYETAILFYTPFSPYLDRSIERMFEIALKYEQNEQFEYALDVYENLRSSLYATRSFYQPYPHVIEACDNKISELLGKIKK
jgi:hypothetical protein